MTTNWIVWIGIVGAITAVFALKRMGQISPQAAQEWLGKGAVVVDVRSLEEYRERHLPGAAHIPLGELRDLIGQRVPNREQGILLHCLSGGRSAVAKGMLTRMGYRNVFNLGSYTRAASIVNRARKSPMTPGS